MTNTFNRLELTQLLSAGATSLDLFLEEATLERLIDYLVLLAKWNAVYNLTAIRDPQQMVTQHLLDALSILPAFLHVKHVLDVGAGGGLPGMVLAIWAQQANPALRISMVDTVHKKTAFLTQAKVELGLTNVTVHTGRVEALKVTQLFDVITSRAFAELVDFVNWSAHLLAEDGRFIAMKGQLPVDEIARLPSGWKVAEIRPLQVPGLNAERHLIFIERDTA
ncbi:16S rRNA (guanine(527)-N(7))-methyltransferase RsmG [Actimicrobium sp. CCC2.4]|uniref:16S rRNA (guanine(527)-N(7))-methyltransferase RsmG n=1 Tax=Actimicrobium sp. CCC2.4 TaxID=3048606 RepID=UPI002AC8DEE4|nr:16S rRNA (guanine(527)-N(7))-methyltransferase RsmG [Actimicrobium sp. CCC2.4]MEB0135910.1 16S rRNA (guanine(527)-N(7))-methyltransferase RsmG [Actimicrobium sp. CCC2.4]WPX32577.1 16S rRNA (guanine(527)-N(7))-methyltransferase RsmG [Actimicrobium sp. CCC2.4]